MPQSVCIFHNGNSKVLEYYKEKYKHLEFCGNGAVSATLNDTNCLYEISFADATPYVLYTIKQKNIKILRHLSEYANDQANLLPECCSMPYKEWTEHIAINLISFADKIVVDTTFDVDSTNQVVLLTTGRTASKHVEEHLRSQGIESYEVKKPIQLESCSNAGSAILLWRENQWENAVSHWISAQTGLWTHNSDQQNNVDWTKITLGNIPNEWFDVSWFNQTQQVFDYAIFFKYVLSKDVKLLTTEQAISKFASSHRKINYNKKDIISDYYTSLQHYNNSLPKEITDYLYQTIQQKIKRYI
jgi:hypothetical protein